MFSGSNIKGEEGIRNGKTTLTGLAKYCKEKQFNTIIQIFLEEVNTGSKINISQTPNASENQHRIMMNYENYGNQINVFICEVFCPPF